MKAVRLLDYGGQLEFNDVPTPTVARDEILVGVKSTAVGRGRRDESHTARSCFMGPSGVSQR